MAPGPSMGLLRRLSFPMQLQFWEHLFMVGFDFSSGYRVLVLSSSLDDRSISCSEE